MARQDDDNIIPLILMIAFVCVLAVLVVLAAAK